jgi:hypothetical protein
LRSHLEEPPMLPQPTLPKRTVTTTVETAPAPDLGQEFLEGGT